MDVATSVLTSFKSDGFLLNAGGRYAAFLANARRERAISMTCVVVWLMTTYTKDYIHCFENEGIIIWGNHVHQAVIWNMPFKMGMKSNIMTYTPWIYNWDGKLDILLDKPWDWGSIAEGGGALVISGAGNVPAGKGCHLT